MSRTTFFLNNLAKFFHFAILRNPLPNKYIMDDLDNGYLGKVSFTLHIGLQY